MDERGGTVGERIRTWRKSHGLTQAELARYLDVDAISISRWERGAQQPPEGMLDLALRELERRLKAEAS